MPIEAVYSPLTVADDGAENPCHYLLLPAEGDIRDLFVKLNRLAHDDYPKSKPTDAFQVAIWEAADRRCKEALLLHLDARTST